MENGKLKQKISRAYLTGAFLGLTLGVGSVFTMGYAANKIIPNPHFNKVQEGFVDPSRLEVDCQDLDGNGELESFVKIDDTPYFLKETEDGTEISSSYFGSSSKNLEVRSSQYGIRSI